MKPELTALIVSLGLSYHADFVPFSRSRNAKSAPKLSELRLNWRVSISKDGSVLATDYSQGIGHIPGYKYENRPSVDYADAVRKTCESGANYFCSLGARKVPAPTLAEVLHSLVLDSDAIESPTFEDWANEYGYDTDSREAERIYRACLEIGLKLRAMIGDATLVELREAFRDC